MSKHVFKIEDGKFGLTTTAPTGTDPCTATLAAYGAGYTCQITSGALTASPNVTQETIPATWCDPEESVPQVGKTSYSLEIAYLQDPDLVAGLSRFLFEHDAELAYFYMGLDGDDPPKAIGQCRLVSGAVGGEGRVTLTATATLPVEGKPLICFGDAASHAPVGGDPASRGHRQASPARSPGCVDATGGYRVADRRHPERRRRLTDDGVDDRPVRADRHDRCARPRPLVGHVVGYGCRLTQQLRSRKGLVGDERSGWSHRQAGEGAGRRDRRRDPPLHRHRRAGGRQGGAHPVDRRGPRPFGVRRRRQRDDGRCPGALLGVAREGHPAAP